MTLRNNWSIFKSSTLYVSDVHFLKNESFLKKSDCFN